MISFSFNSPAEFENLSHVQTAFREKGGAIILYRTVWSFFSISRSVPRLVHVLPDESRTRVGLRESGRTLWAGWWSISGALQTGSALAHNLSGGIDVTYIYQPNAPTHDDEGRKKFQESFEKEQTKIDRRGLVAAPLGLVVMIAFAVGFFVSMDALNDMILK